MKINKLIRVAQAAAIFLILASFVGCAMLQSEAGKEAVDKGLTLLERLGNMIPIPGAGIVDEVVAFVVALYGLRKGYDGLKNSTPGKFFGGKTE